MNTVVRIAIIIVCISSFGIAYADMKSALEAVEKQDFKRAAELFKQLAEQGDPEAQHNMAMLFREGKGVKEDKEQAAYWFRKAADQGVADAQFNLGNMYEFGIALEQNYQYAAVWYGKAAKQGHPSAQTNLGVLYAAGQGVKQDIIQAYVWLNLAAAQGVKAAFENREIVAKELSPTMLKNVRTVSREYFQKYVAPFQVRPTPHSRRPPPADKAAPSKSN